MVRVPSCTHMVTPSPDDSRMTHPSTTTSESAANSAAAVESSPPSNVSPRSVIVPPPKMCTERPPRSASRTVLSAPSVDVIVRGRSMSSVSW